jgi:spore coat polysaccharide biosynthesis predicted glycosyltransferase SpsG
MECESVLFNLKEYHGLKEYSFWIYGDESARKYLESKGIEYTCARPGEFPDDALIEQADAILVDLRKPQYDFLYGLRRFKKKIIVIDDLGGFPVTADILVNFSINDKRHSYQYPDSQPLSLSGPEYYPAGKAVLDALKTPKSKRNNNVLISLGGFGSPDLLKKVLTALKKYDQYQKEVILGPGYFKDNSFNQLTKSLDDSFSFFESVSDLPGRIRKSRFLINTGGNTLYEAGIVGTPVLVLGEEAHEVEQGELFEKRGLAINLVQGKSATIQEIERGIEDIGEFTISPEKAISLKPWMHLICV